MNIDWKKIKEKCPKGYRKLFFFYCYDDKEYDFDFENDEFSDQEESMEANVCYCDLEKFFDKNGIRIFILPYFASIGNDELERYQIVIIDNIKAFKDGDSNKTSDEAKIQAIYKAFEIMEKMLNEAN